jgi:hypothetical protein
VARKTPFHSAVFSGGSYQWWQQEGESLGVGFQERHFFSDEANTVAFEIDFNAFETETPVRRILLKVRSGNLKACVIWAALRKPALENVV